MTRNTESDPTADVRKLPVWAFIVLAIVYPAILLALIRLLTPDLYVSYARFTSVEIVWRALLLPYGTAVLFVAAAVTALGWWRPVLRDHRPVRRWVRVVPIIMGVAALGGSNYPELADKGASFTLLLLLGALLVGCGEEAMYRGVGVTTFRVNGYSEGKVALWSSVVFGLCHGVNLFTSQGKIAFAHWPISSSWASCWCAAAGSSRRNGRPAPRPRHDQVARLMTRPPMLRLPSWASPWHNGCGDLRPADRWAAGQ